MTAIGPIEDGPTMKERKSGDGGAAFSLPLIGLCLPGRNVSMARVPERDDRPALGLRAQAKERKSGENPGGRRHI
jgi:hypothetical protein